MLDQSYPVSPGDINPLTCKAHVLFQIYIQRVLCTKDSKVPKFMSVLGALLTLFLVLPGILIGAVARSTGRSGHSEVSVGAISRS